MTSSKIQLLDVTLIALTSHKIPDHEDAIKKSCEGIEFGGVKIIYDFNIKTIDQWSYEMVYNLGDYVQTSHALIIHADGYVINPQLWKDEWLQYDYIGAPFPLPIDNFSYRDINDKIQRVGNSVGLRSKKLMQLPKKLGMEWKPFHGYWHEDGFISVNMRHVFEEHGCKFAPLEVAVHFSKEYEIPENVGLSSFMFHKVG